MFSSRFLSATCICFQLWLVYWIVCVICYCPEGLLWFLYSQLKTALFSVILIASVVFVILPYESIILRFPSILKWIGKWFKISCHCSLENSKFFKEWMGSLVLLPPRKFAVFESQHPQLILYPKSLRFSSQITNFHKLLKSLEFIRIKHGESMMRSLRKGGKILTVMSAKILL